MQIIINVPDNQIGCNHAFPASGVECNRCGINRHFHSWIQDYYDQVVPVPDQNAE